MPKIQFKFKIFGEPGALSTESPETEFRILANLPTEAGLLVILEAPMANTAASDRYLDKDNWLSDYEVLHADEQRVVIQMVCDFVQPPAYRAVIDSGNILQYPLILRNGWAIADLTTSHERLSRLKDAFEAAGLAYEVGAVTQSTEPTNLLTDRQREFITEAVKSGYYESPRECTLTDLAAALDVTKGAASGTLHRAERRIIKTFLGEPAV
jgi:predicted DNA binding protein